MLSKLLREAPADLQSLSLRRCHRTGGKSGAATLEEDESQMEIHRLQALISDLTARAKEQAKEAFAAGFRAGETEITERLAGEARAAAGKLVDAVSGVLDSRAEVIRQAEADTVHLAVEIARRVLHRELTTDVSALESLISAALTKLQAQEVYRVRVHPDQEELLRTCLEEAGRGQEVAIVRDPLQPPGGALFEVSGGALDASLETQLSEIERGLMDQLGVGA